MVGLGIAVVVILYGVTVFSNRDGMSAAPPEAQPSAEASTGSAELPDSLRVMAAALEAEGTASGWTQLGHLYFTVAMQSGDETVRAEQASRAVDAFDLSLGIEENPDVRTSLAEAAQFDPRNPMRAVLELQAVLGAAPDHVAANYLLGALRSRIGRLDGAAESFQRVIDLTPEDDPIHQRAAEDLAAVRQTMASAPSTQ
jgi:cytochrome c-type biogenesis protein CcmH/NrfG